MPKNIWHEVVKWQGANRLINSTAIQGPDDRRTLIWETTAQNGVAVIEKIGDDTRGHFVDVKIHEKPFKTVVSQVKRARTLARQRLEREAKLC